MRQWFQLIASATQEPAWRNPIAVSLGAIGGALCRYYLGLWLTRTWGSSFPVGTLFVNITGSFLLGLFATLAAERWLSLPPEWMLLFGVGFLGSYTTFSSYQLDTLRLLDRGSSWLAWSYWLGSPLLGLAGVRLGVAIARLGSP